MKCDVETDSRKADEVSELKDRAKKIKQKITHFQKETNQCFFCFRALLHLFSDRHWNIRSSNYYSFKWQII